MTVAEMTRVDVAELDADDVSAAMRFTPDDVLALESDGLYELADGLLVEKPMSMLSNWVSGQVLTRVNVHLEDNPVARAFPEQTFRCFAHDPDRIRRPDVAVVLLSRLADFPEGHLAVRPDIAVEVVSPNDTVYDLDAKLADYRRAGVPLVWVVNPLARLIRVHRADGRVVERREGETIDAEPVLPGFSAAVADFFPATPAPAAAAST